VLAEHRRLELERLGEGGEAERERRHLDFAEEAILDRPDRAAGAEVGVRHRLGNREHGRDRHADLLQRRDHRLVALGGREPSFDRRDDLVAVLDPPRVRRVALVRDHLGATHQAAERRPTVVHERHDDQIALLPAEDSGRTDLRMVMPRADRRDGAAGGTVELHVDLVTVEVGVEDRDVEILPLARPLAVEERASDRAHRVRAGRDVAETEHRQHREAFRIADHVRHARVGLGDEIVARLLRERSRLAERGDRAHDDLRVQRADVLVTEPHAADRSRRVVLDEHVDLGRELAEQRPSLRALHVDAEALLPAVLLHVIRAPPVLHERQTAAEIALRRDLDLDHLRTHLDQETSAGRPGEHLREVENAIPVEHVARLRHRRPSGPSA
jgi:hypothetical protein